MPDRLPERIPLPFSPECRMSPWNLNRIIERRHSMKNYRLPMIFTEAQKESSKRP